MIHQSGGQMWILVCFKDKLWPSFQDQLTDLHYTRCIIVYFSQMYGENRKLALLSFFKEVRKSDGAEQDA